MFVLMLCLCNFSFAQFVVNSQSQDELLKVDNTGTMSIMALQGTGTRMVITNADGEISAQAIPSGDNLGNHAMSQNLKTSGKWISNDGGNEGVYVNAAGNVGVKSNSPKAILHVDGTPPSASGLWPTRSGTANNGYARLFLPVTSYPSTNLNFGLSNYLPIRPGTGYSGRGVSSIIYKQDGGLKGIASGVLGKTDGSSFIYGDGYNSVIAVTGQVFNTFTDAYFTAGGYFQNERTGNTHWGIYVDASNSRVTGDIELGTGSEKRVLYACGAPIQGVVVIGGDALAALANCKRVNPGVTAVNLLPITVNIN